MLVTENSLIWWGENTTNILLTSLAFNRIPHTDTVSIVNTTQPAHYIFAENVHNWQEYILYLPTDDYLDTFLQQWQTCIYHKHQIPGRHVVYMFALVEHEILARRLYQDEQTQQEKHNAAWIKTTNIGRKDEEPTIRVRYGFDNDIFTLEIHNTTSTAVRKYSWPVLWYQASAVNAILIPKKPFWNTILNVSMQMMFAW